MDERHAITGFPSACEEHRRPPLNLHTLLAPRPHNTFFARHTGDAMAGARILDGDLLVIKYLGDYNHGQIVLGFIGEQRLVRRLEKRDGRLFICPANSRYREIEMNEEAQVFGRVVHSITHHIRNTQHLPAVC